MGSRRRAAALCVGALVVLVTGVRAAPEPLAWWSFEEVREGRVADVSGQGHEATLAGQEGKLPQGVPGMAGQGLRFDPAAEQYLTVAHDTALKAPPVFTVMAWIKPQARGGTYEIIGNKGDRDASGAGQGWRLRYFWSRLAFEFATTSGELVTVYTPEWSVMAGYWSHVAASCDGKMVQLFVNAELLATREATGPITPSPRGVLLANYVGRKNAYPFAGLLDEVKLFPAALSPEEVFVAATQGMR